MADLGLRELERRWQASGSPDDEARWLVARVRRGELDLGRVELAACCDHLAAAQALHALGLAPSPTSWVTDVRRWGDDVCVRATLAAARRALPVWAEAFPDDARPAAILGLVERWLEPAGDDPAHALLDADDAAAAAQLEAEDAADLAASWGAHLAEDACVVACLAVRALQAAARDAPRTLGVPRGWLRRRPARTFRIRRPPAVVDDFLAATARAARALRVADDIVRREVNAEVAAWALRATIRLEDRIEDRIATRIEDRLEARVETRIETRLEPPRVATS